MKVIWKAVVLLAKRRTELDIISEIKRRLPKYKADYIFWKYSPCCLSYEPQENTFAELKQNSPGFPQEITERQAEQWLLDDTVQGAVKLLLERKNVQQLHDLHEQYFQMAQTDPQSLRALLELNKALFKQEDNALLKLLQNVPDDLDGGADE